jgi:micrococcal nuclease
MKRCAILLTLVLAGCGGRPELPETGTVKRVVDGDTILLADGNRLRFLAVDAPESVHPHKPVEYFGKEASDFTRRLLTGERVRLVYDQNCAHRGHRDHFGRLLAYVFRARDGLDVCAELVKQGYAHAYLKYPVERGEEFLGYEKEARAAGRGLWAPRPGPAGSPAAAAPRTATPRRDAAEGAGKRAVASSTTSGTILAVSEVAAALATTRLHARHHAPSDPPQ